MASTLIVNSKPGGHAAIGYYLAKELVTAGHDVALFNAGSKDKLGGADPFASYPDLEKIGVSIAWGDPASKEIGSVLDSAFGNRSFDVIYENNSKAVEDITPLVEYAQGQKVSQFIYVGSCGAYQKSDEVPLIEGDAVKSSAGQIAVESLLASSGLNYSAFRPIYIIGPKCSKKEYIDYFFHRIVRNRPVFFPASSDLMTSVTHIADVAAMLALALGNKNAENQIFNVVAPRYISHAGVARLCAKAAGKEAEIVEFSPATVPSALAKIFPYRSQHFFASPGKAMRLLGWKSTYPLEEAVKEAYEEFMATGKDKIDYDFSVDDSCVGMKETLSVK